MTLENAQVILVDQPGLLEPKYLLHSAMREAAIDSLKEADAILYTIAVDDAVEELEDLLGGDMVHGKPTALVRTKSDNDSNPHRGDFFVSAHTGDGLEALKAWCVQQIPVREFRHDSEDMSVQPVRFFAAEYIREAAFELLDEELPYAVAVEIDEFREGSDPLYIGGTILVERETQKRMVIGKSGQMIRTLGTRARARIEELLGQRVYLDLWVKVLPKWRSKPGSLARFGLPVTETKK